LVQATGDLDLKTDNFLASGTGKSTNLVEEFDEVKPTTVAGMGALTVIITKSSTSGWMFFTLYTSTGEEIQVGIGDNLEDGTISAYVTLDAKTNFEVPNSDNAVGYRLSSDGSMWGIETTRDYGKTWNDGLSWNLDALPEGLTRGRVIDIIALGSYDATAGYCQVSWECDDFENLNAPNPSCAATRGE
jgi:hypothetical protein